jgi:hypothetical protein
MTNRQAAPEPGLRGVVVRKNVRADVKALETLGLVETEGEAGERYRKALRTDFNRIEVQIEL